MREGWEYKKLGDICDIYQPKTISAKELVENGNYLVYGANGVIGRYNSYNHINSEVLMTCRGATCGTINVSKPYSWINGNAMVIHPKNNRITQAFLSYHLKGIDLSDVITGAAQPQITRQSLSPKKVFIPPLAEQEKIVAELDLLSSVIEKKKAQLKHYDQLAQSIFYDMFGDPTDNPMGWKRDILSNVCETVTDFVAAGSFADLRENVQYIDTPDYAQLIRTVDLKNGFLKKAFIYVNKHAFDYLWRVNLNKEAIILPNVGVNCGEVYYVNPSLLPYSNNVLGPNSIMVRSNHENHIYLSYFFQSPYFHSQIKQITNAVGQPKYNKTELKKLYVIVPPLSLQQEFANKIEAIEQQKSLIQQSIKETETLFNSRMDYYFN